MRTLFALIGVVIFVAVVEARDEILLTVSPRQTMAPAYKSTYVRAAWRIAQHADNRFWSLAWGSDIGASGSSLGQMEGEAARVHYEQIVEVETGGYTFECCVYRSNRQRYCDRQDVTVR